MNQYETLRSFQGVFALLPEHASRFECPELENLLAKLMVQKDVCVKLVRENNDVFVEKLRDLEPWSGSFLSEEIWSYKLFEGVRENPEVKCLKPDWLKKARAEALEEGYGELLLMSEEGYLCEGSISNVFLVKGPRIVTPSEDCLPGIGRSLILKAAADRDVCVELRDVKVEELDEADALFFVNSIRGVVMAEGSEVLPIIQKLLDWCSKFIQNRVDGKEDEVHGHH